MQSELLLWEAVWLRRDAVASYVSLVSLYKNKKKCRTVFSSVRHTLYDMSLL